MKSVELFTGAGGLAMGLHKAGFEHSLVVEWDHNACEALRANKSRGMKLVKDWDVVEGDVSTIDFRPFEGKVDLLAGGPPCQPFSLGGKHRGMKDRRNMFPEMIRAVREMKPRAILVENVKGLLRKSFMDFFEYVVLQLAHPCLVAHESETWAGHRDRLERRHTKGRSRGLSYNVVFRLVNTANYGIPQRRERVFILAIRSDLKMEWSFPEETHSLDSLLVDQWITGEYWERHRIPRKKRPADAGRHQRRVRSLRTGELFDESKPWRTVRDAVRGLPDPRSPKAKTVLNHGFQPGARSYKGHTGSPLDLPSKALKAGDHGVPGGENMMVEDDGAVRYFTVRESARMQTFPDDFVFNGSWSENMRQLGNAVPVDIGEILGRRLVAML